MDRITRPLRRSSIVLLMIASFVLAACGANPETSATADQEQPTAAATSAPTTEPTEAPTVPANPTATEETDSAATESEPTVPPEPSATPEPAEPTTPPEPAGPVSLSDGTFNVIDDLHAGTGTVSLIQQPDGSHILRLNEDFTVTFGPDLFVWLSTHTEPRTGAEAQEGYVNLGRLQAREGIQEYVIPADVDISAYQSALIWCRAFSQVMTSAGLSAE